MRSRSLYQVAITKDGAPVVDYDGAVRACQLLGFAAIEVEEVQADVGCWMVALPTKDARRLRLRGTLELTAEGYHLEGEMP